MWLSTEALDSLRQKVDIAKEAMVSEAVEEIVNEGYAILKGFVPDDVERVLNKLGVELGNTISRDLGYGLKEVLTIAYLSGNPNREDSFPSIEKMYPVFSISFEEGDYDNS